MQCNFREATWNLVATRFALLDYNTMSATGGPVYWVRKIISEGSKREKKRKLGILCTFWWMILKVSRIVESEDKHSSAIQVAGLAKEEIKLHLLVFHRFLWLHPLFRV
jgi:hypothetical protein